MFVKVKNWIKNHKTLFALIITALFIVAQIPALVTHEAWNDEAISWEISREITPTNIYELNSAEPHPLLWQIILSPFSKLGFPFETLGVISLVFVALAVFLIFRFAPMNLFVKLAFLLSSGLFYYLPIISRDYSLVPLALALICMAYNTRHEHPLRYSLSLVFLTQTHFLMYGFAAALAFGFILEETFKKNKIKTLLKNLALFLIPLIISIASVAPVVIGSMNTQAVITEKAFTKVDAEDRDIFLPNFINTLFGDYNYGFEIIFFALVAIITLSILVKNWKVGLYLIAGEGLWFYVMTNIYKSYNVLPPKVSLIVLILFASTWLIHLEKEKEKSFLWKITNHSELVRYFREHFSKNFYLIVTTIFALVTIPGTFSYMIDDYSYPFANSKEIAEFLDSIEPGSLYIEGDTSGLVNAASHAYMHNDVVFYNNIYGRYEEKSDYLKYDNHNLETYLAFETGSDEELEKLFAEMGRKYEHIYYAVNPISCGSNNIYIPEKYNEAALLGDNTYLGVSYARIEVYKIK